METTDIPPAGSLSPEKWSVHPGLFAVDAFPYPLTLCKWLFRPGCLGTPNL